MSKSKQWDASLTASTKTQLFLYHLINLSLLRHWLKILRKFLKQEDKPNRDRNFTSWHQTTCLHSYFCSILFKTIKSHHLLSKPRKIPSIQRADIRNLISKLYKRFQKKHNEILQSVLESIKFLNFPKQPNASKMRNVQI